MKADNFRMCFFSGCRMYICFRPASTTTSFTVEIRMLRWTKWWMRVKRPTPTTLSWPCRSSSTPWWENEVFSCPVSKLSSACSAFDVWCGLCRYSLSSGGQRQRISIARALVKVTPYSIGPLCWFHCHWNIVHSKCTSTVFYWCVCSVFHFHLANLKFILFCFI